MSSVSDFQRREDDAVAVSMPGQSAVTPTLGTRPHIPRVRPQQPLQFLRRQPSSEPSARVLLGSLDEGLAQALVQAFAALGISGSRPRLQVVHDQVQSSGPRTPGARPVPPPGAERWVRCGAGGWRGCWTPGHGDPNRRDDLVARASTEASAKHTAGDDALFAKERTGRPGAVRCAVESGNKREEEPQPRGRGQADGDHCEPQGQHARGLLATPSPDGASSLERVVASWQSSGHLASRVDAATVGDRPRMLAACSGDQPDL